MNDIKFQKKNLADVASLLKYLVKDFITPATALLSLLTNWHRITVEFVEIVLTGG